MWFKVPAVVIFNALENSSFIITRCFRTCPKINYIMSALKFSFVINIEIWTKFVTSKSSFSNGLGVEHETCTFMLLGNDLFIVLWYHKQIFFVMFSNYSLITGLRGFIFVWDITIWHWISLFSFYLFTYLIYYPIRITISISKNSSNMS